MPETDGLAAARWADALQAIELLAVDRAGLGGVCLRAQAGPVRDRWLAALSGSVANIRRMPAAIGDAALLGGLDLAATLRGGRPVRAAGLLEQANGGLVLAAMAERMADGVAARVGAAMDDGADLAVVALDEGIEPEERCAAALLDRLAFHLDLTSLSYRDAPSETADPARIEAARARLPEVETGDAVVEALCGTSLALGIGSGRAPLLALRAARAAAALDGRDSVDMADATLATRLVLAPRATRLPAAEPEADESEPDESEPGDAPPDQPSEPPDQPPDAEDQPRPKSEEALGEMLLAAAVAAIPDGLLARLRAQDFRQRAAAQGREGARQKSAQRGRPVGVRAAAPSPGLRLNLIETLRAAAPWQRLRTRDDAAPSGRVALRREDFRVTLTESRGSTTTIFVVDASGSSALNRLAEAKGAVELLLADCYRRRDQVAVIAFRGKTAQILLPPTRSLVRAKRSLAALPGGGGTPLAAGLDSGLVMAQAVRRGGATPTIVLLTDGRANVTRAGTGGREVAAGEAEQAGRMLRAAGIAALVLDTSPRPAAVASRLAAAMGALYVPLPYANAANVSAAVRAAGRTA
jgi:magnesium chelatase subunit D